MVVLRQPHLVTRLDVAGHEVGTTAAGDEENTVTNSNGHALRGSHPRPQSKSLSWLVAFSFREAAINPYVL